MCEERIVKSGEIYKHFKGHIYKIVCIAKDSEDENVRNMVVYKEVGTENYWVRPLSMFLEKVDKKKYPNVEQVYRFEKIDSEEECISGIL